MQGGETRESLHSVMRPTGPARLSSGILAGLGTAEVGRSCKRPRTYSGLPGVTLV